MTPRERALEALQEAHVAVLDWVRVADGDEAELARDVLRDTSVAFGKARR